MRSCSIPYPTLKISQSTWRRLRGDEICSLQHSLKQAMKYCCRRGHSIFGPNGQRAMPEAHWNRLADRDVFVLPGSVMNMTNYFRISLTASDSMVERALPAFSYVSA